MPVFVQRRAAFRTCFIRQVKSPADFSVRKKFTVLAMRANIMRRQRIDFRNVGHRSDKGRTDRPTRPYEIAVIVGMFYQFVRNVIQDTEPVAENRCKFFFQSVFYDFRQRVAVNPVRFFITHVFQRFGRTGNLREVQCFLRHRPNIFNHFINLVGIGDNDFSGAFFAKVHKFPKHFIRSPQVQIRLELRIFKALARHQDFTINFIFRIEEMGITSCYGHLTQLIAEF